MSYSAVARAYQLNVGTREIPECLRVCGIRDNHILAATRSDPNYSKDGGVSVIFVSETLVTKGINPFEFAFAYVWSALVSEIQ